MSSTHPVGQGFRTSVRRYLVAPLALLIAASANSARHEPELFIRLQEPGTFEPLYRRILEAARLEGLGEAQVPDFLGALEGQETIDLLGQEELGPVQVAHALDEMFDQQRLLGEAFGFTEARRHDWSSSAFAWPSTDSHRDF